LHILLNLLVNAKNGPTANFCLFSISMAVGNKLEKNKLYHKIAMNSSTSIKHNPKEKGNGCPQIFRSLLLIIALALLGGGVWGQTTTYNSGSGNYTVPPGVSEIIVQVWGADTGMGKLIATTTEKLRNDAKKLLVKY
jgi:hypothetical protein